MLFNSYIFLFLFFPLTLLAFYGVRRLGKMSWSVPALVIASLCFYAASGAFYLTLLIGSILFNFTISRLIGNAPAGRSKLFLIVGITANLCMLGYFKYYNFFLTNIVELTGAALTLHKIALPIGISFFTFTQLAYLVDCFKSRSSERNLINYALFVTIFPHLIAGPIIHHAQVRPQFERLKVTPIDPAMVSVGLIMFVIGLGKKVLIADNVAGTASLIFDAADHGASISTVMAWIGTVAYTLQIYFDFSGYSDMAIGLALIFGVKLPLNFNSPYKSKSIIEFWRRWHMTLSTWLRDYVYIPLGGNRKGEFQRLRNVFITMLVGGIWHGAGWTFVIWGALHGTYIVLNHLIRKIAPDRFKDDMLAMRIGKQLVTLLLVMIGWVFFRATSVSGATSILSGMIFSGGPDTAQITLETTAYLALAAAGLIALFAPNTQQLTGYTEDSNTPVAYRPEGSFNLLKPAQIKLGINPVTAVYCGLIFAFVLAFIWRPSIFIYFNF